MDPWKQNDARTEKTYNSWKKQKYAVQKKINSPMHSTEEMFPMYKDTTGGSQAYLTDRRNIPRVREHKLVSRRDIISNMGSGWGHLPQKTLAQKGFDMSNRKFSMNKMARFNVSRSVTKRGGILGKTLGAIAMIGINMLKKSGLGVNKGARAIIDYTASKSVLGAARLGLMRDSKMLKPPAGLVSALSRTRHGRGI